MLAEAALVGFLGGVIGSVLGIAIGYLAIGELPSTMVQTLDARLEYVLPPWVVPLAVVACVVASVSASAMAARQVHGVAPIEALAPGGAATAETGSQRLKSIAGVAGATLLVATVIVVTSDLGQLAIASIALSFIVAAAPLGELRRDTVRTRDAEGVDDAPADDDGGNDHDREDDARPMPTP
ncbi:MAG TPA: FtsX-like permease family protein, partial [Mycobacterium sp.]|nr:FtsX-like permease family protein [Mycobacterium sp.]